MDLQSCDEESGEGKNSPVIMSQPLHEPRSLDGELHKCFSVFSLPQVDRMAGVGYFPSSGQLGPDNNIPIG